MKNKKSILYILGAGASAEVLPLVNSYTDQDGVRHRSLIGELTLFSEVLKNKALDDSYYKLCQEASDFLTPDTFARFLFLNGRLNEYKRFKILLSAYFFYREKLHELGKPCVDKRMLSFKNDTSLVYLNGIAGYAYNHQSRNIISKESTIDRSIRDLIEDTAGLDQDSKIIRLFNIYENPTENLLISFAWEKDSNDNSIAHFVSDRLQYAKAVARGTDILIVIGYSFPFFNREIDNMIFSEMPTLRKIYFQDPNLDGKYLQSQFSLGESVQIEHVKQVNHYFVPFEL